MAMLKEIKPASLKDAKIDALLDAFDGQLQNIYNNIINVLIYPRIDELSGKILDALAWQFHIEGWELAETDEEKRELIKQAIELHRHKGTRWAVKKAFEVVDIQADIVEWFENNGNGEPYTFNIKLKFEKDIESLNRLLDVIQEYKNERSKPYVDYEIVRSILFNFFSNSIQNLDFDKNLDLKSDAALDFSNKNIFNLRADLDFTTIKHTENIKASSREIYDLDIDDLELRIEREMPYNPSAKATLNIFYPTADRSVFSLPIPPIERTVYFKEMAACSMQLQFEETADIFHLKEVTSAPLYFDLMSDNFKIQNAAFASIELYGEIGFNLNINNNLRSKATIYLEIGGQ